MGNFDEVANEPEWKESMFENYEKMNISHTFSTSFLGSDLPANVKVLRAQPVFKIKLQEEVYKYDLYTKTTVNGSSQIQGIDFKASFVQISFFENIGFLLAIAAVEAIPLFLLYASNAFKNNIESNLTNYPLNITFVDSLCFQAVCPMQRSKNTGRKWYLLLKAICINALGM
eukprot:8754369-Ditylum_brightwellii.AAC.1